MSDPKLLRPQESLDADIRRALQNHAIYLWGTITTEQIKNNLKTPSDLDSFVDSFLGREGVHKELHESSLDRNYLLALAKNI